MRKLSALIFGAVTIVSVFATIFTTNIYTVFTGVIAAFFWGVTLAKPK